jgi:hypothetical protein
MRSIQSVSSPDIVAYRKWLTESGVSSTTGWRWRKEGWICPVNIAGRLYVTREQIETFCTRAASGEFAKSASGAAAHAMAASQVADDPDAPQEATEELGKQ